MEVLKGELNSTSTYVPAQLTKDQLLEHHINTLTKINVKIDKCELPTFYWLPKLHKRPYKSRFISNSSHCSTTILSKHITSALTAVKDHVMKYSETAFSNSNREVKQMNVYVYGNLYCYTHTYTHYWFILYLVKQVARVRVRVLSNCYIFIGLTNMSSPNIRAL